MKTVASDLPLTASVSARWRDYLALLKPRVMSLVVFTAVTGLICAGAPLSPMRGAGAIVCIAGGAGAAAALNMWYDADIDRLMRRTRDRPIPAGRTPPAEALALGLMLALLSVGTMLFAFNLLAAGLLAFTILFYAVVYTMWLKRRTPQNIVVGGLAGALPPAVGWAAAAGNVPLNAWLLVAIIFIWTPPHFWSLSLLAKDDYQRARVPMMPVVKGEASTRRLILLYSLVLAPLGVLPAFTGLGGVLYLLLAIAAGTIFVAFAARLAMRPTARAAAIFFAYSIAYLVMVFATLLFERLYAERMAL